MRLLLIIVEGDHDVAFVERSLRSFKQLQPFTTVFADYPRPLGGRTTKFLLQYVQRAATEQFQLADANKALTPRLACALSGSDTLALVFESHGVEQKDTEKLVKDLVKILAGDDLETDFELISLAFIVDADDIGIDARVAQILQRYGTALGLNSMVADHWIQGTKFRVLTHVFTAPGEINGALEHHLAPLVKQQRQVEWNGALTFIDQMTSPSNKLSTKPADRLKAIITCSGQFEYPGHGMSKIVRYNAIDSEVFRSSKEASALADLLLSTSSVDGKISA